MASMIDQQQVDALVRKVKGQGMVNRVLQQICAAESMTIRGVKADMQQRIIERIQSHAQKPDVTHFNRLKYIIENPGAIPQTGGSPLIDRMPREPALPVAYGYAAAAPPRLSYGLDNLNLFKPSPFYTIETQLGEMKTLEAMANHRHSVTIPIRVSQYPMLTRLATDPSLRVMVFCAAGCRGPEDIAFPHQSEVKVNGGEVKANLRGLKNKPGSTRPVDITKELRLKIPQYTNNVELTYALTSKVDGGSHKFYLLLYLVKTVSVQDLVKKLETGQRITKERVLNDMANKARDADIVATASVLSLKCPLSTLRIDLPCRSISCRHNQCFDATSYLQLQEQGPTWLCPICNNSAPFNSLAVDEYVKDILKNTSRSVDQVTVEPDGKWELYAKSEPTSKTNGVASRLSSDDDDDLVEITKSGDSIRMSTPRRNGTPAVAALPPSMREASAASTSASRSLPPTTAKRPAPVIDLTSSGDEDDEPIARQPKRQFTNNSANGFASTPAYRPGPGTINGYPPRT